ncbi:AAA family ATPase [Stenotrophomonas indicatrix]|uniref:AAA family ATPase n=1 Tax=Stenotrophomonas indicatrix TaxID=2045451 RepID=UPI003CCE9DF9
MRSNRSSRRGWSYADTDTVFVVQPWPEIYVQDRWRKADFARASRSFEPTVAAYAERGYGTRIVPQVSVEERVAFVLQHTVGR